ncbi:lipocalin-like domain-containing protein [Candidatus Eisenbacteria bacterium]|uniref:Lipocalin-like domain-containing protein n=1 Tax=Eiseniibacteriota bacterium TaxID=2212470 RepID=A0ABV6YKK9_UNCEI
MRYHRSMLLGALLLILPISTAHGTSCDGYAFLEDLDCHAASKVIMEGLPDRTDWTDQAGYYDFQLVAGGWHTFHYKHPGFYSEDHDFFVNLFGNTRLPDVILESRALCNPASWQSYPYSIPAAGFTFPDDEGIHNPLSTYPVEWWYGNFHLTGAQTGKEYALWIAFFKFPYMVLMSVTDLETGESWSADRYPATFTAAEDKLDIAISLPPFTDRWYNEVCGDDLHAFEYWMDLNWLDAGVVDGYLHMRSIKPPMAIGGDGFIEMGSGWTYYYSQPRMHVQGLLHVPGGPALGEEVEGHGWMDHQWGNLPTERISWEWISIQLEGMIEIMVADVWVDGIPEGSFSGGLNYYDSGCDAQVLPDYEMTPIETYADPVSGRQWAVAWHVTEPSRQIDLVIEPGSYDHVMRLGIFDLLPLCFWESPCTVTGSIGGQPVQGTAFTEVTHPQSCSVGSCCLPDRDGMCVLMTELECTGAGGEFGAYCEACEPNPCGGGVDHRDEVHAPLQLAAGPNPLTRSTYLQYNLGQPGMVDVTIYDSAGRVVRRLLSKQSEAGDGAIEWDGLDDTGARVSSGTYVCCLAVNDTIISRRLTVVD